MEDKEMQNYTPKKPRNWNNVQIEVRMLDKTGNNEENNLSAAGARLFGRKHPIHATPLSRISIGPLGPEMLVRI